MSLEIKKNDFLRQFEAKVEGCLIKLEYSEQAKNIFLTRFEIDKSLSEEKYQDLFIKKVLDLLVEEDGKVVPTCPKVAAFFKKNRSEYKHLLPVGITL
ncbi:MAG: N-acetyltransferase [Bacteroidetes bacterium]|jgi:predicted GNAT family acetyltransferase|nr:N-acetyltransferase [Bacteroidota bacterium]